MTAYRWRDDDREFAALWDEAMETAVDTVESALASWRRKRPPELIPAAFKVMAPLKRLELVLWSYEPQIQEPTFLSQRCGVRTGLKESGSNTKEFKILVLLQGLEPINCRALLEPLSCREWVER